MDPAPFPESNAKDPETGFEALSMIEHGPNGFSRRHIVSKWEPTDEERKRIAEGEPVWLDVIGDTMPIVSISTHCPFQSADQDEGEGEDQNQEAGDEDAEEGGDGQDGPAIAQDPEA